MAVTKKQKQATLERLAKVLKSPSVVFSGFSGVTVQDDTAMRKQYREKGVGYGVFKKTLVRKALIDANLGELPDVEGLLSVGWSEDPTAAAQEVYAFQKSLGDRISIQGGIFEGTVRPKEEMLEIAQIPSHDVLKGMFANVIASPLSRFAVVLSAVAEKKEAVAS